MKKTPRWIQTIVVFLLVYLIFFMPLPLYMEVPGGAFSLDEMVEVNHEYSDDEGDFYITTVGIQSVSPINLLSSVLPYHNLVSKVDVMGELNDLETYNKIQKYYMNHSIHTAIKVAFDAAEKEYDFEYNGVYVLQLIEESNFFKELKIGDIVKSVDGQSFQSSQEFIDYIQKKNVGEEVTLDVVRDTEELSTSGKLILLESGLAGIGIGLVDDTSIITDPEVSIHSANIGGPSAGLMFSLQIYSQLLEENIRGNYKIAGTGTIDSDGKVGQIGGVEKKVVAADREGADYFLVPADEDTGELESNYKKALETAQAIKTDMKIVPIATMNDAIEFLEQLAIEEKTQTTANIIELPRTSQEFDQLVALDQNE